MGSFLSKSETSDFHKNGYVIVKNFFNEKETELLQNASRQDPAIRDHLYDRKDSAEQTEDGRSLQSEQYLFSPTKGLVRVRRNPVPKKNGEGYTKQNNNVIIDGPWLTPDEIVKVLGLDKKEDLNSYESLKSAIEQNYPAELTAKILDSFANNKQIKDIGVPSDLQIQEDVLMYMRKLSWDLEK